MSIVVPMNGFGGGGNPLNCKVVGGTTEPTNPKENTIWVNTSTKITSWDFSATEPQKRSNNKNLLVYPYSQTTLTHNGVTFTDNGDGTIKANGTATADAYFYVVAKDNLMVSDGGTYTLTGCPSGGSGSTYLMRVTDNITGSYWDDTGSGRTKELSTGGVLNLYVFIRIKSGTTVNNLVFKPQFEKGSTATSFVKGDATGQVWIRTGTDSPAAFNALKKNNITVYPISAKQYINGAWVDKTAKSWQNGEWVDWWDGELYKNGNTYENITGGWGTKSVGVNSNYPNTGAVPTVKYNSNSVTISIAQSQSGLWHTKNKISLSGKTKLSVQLSNIGVGTGGNAQAHLQIRTGVSGYIVGHSEVVGSASFIDGTTKKTSATIDLSSLSLPNNQTYYVCIGLYSGATFDVNEIKMS